MGDGEWMVEFDERERNSLCDISDMDVKMLLNLVDDWEEWVDNVSDFEGVLGLK